ncbi:hypothetical protein BH11MYX3_BH11MYX3_46780 [soil metagenome]
MHGTAETVPITQIMTRSIVTAKADATVESLIELMTQHHVGCIPIVDEHDHPKCIVTKLDLIECRGDDRATAREVMMPHAMVISPEASVAKAASLMSSEQIHHLLVVDRHRSLLGVVSSMDITTWLAGQE